MNEIDLIQLKNSIISASNSLAINKTIVNNLNVFPVPDGDTGTNMNMTIKSALDIANKSNAESIKEYLNNFSKGSLLGARGNSGVILSQLIRGFVEVVPDNIGVLNVQDLVKSIVKSSEVAYNAVMKPTEGTILTVAKDMAKAAKKFPKNKSNIIEFLDFVYEEGVKSLDRTPELLPILKESGVVDAGGKGLLCLYEGIIKYLKGDESLLNEGNVAATLSDKFEENVEEAHEHSHTEIKFGYCTEFIIQTEENSAQKAEVDLKEFLNKLGDSLLVIGSDDIVKVHFHTNNPGKALEEALNYGSLSDIKIDNMRLQHNELMFSEEEYKSSQENESNKEDFNKKVEFYQNAFISVSAGDGFDEIFESLGVAKVISGGQTMNPSTEDILKAVEDINGENIFILPNNSNIILAAEQVKLLSSKNVYVIPTKSMPEGISAIFSGINEENPEDVIENSKEAISNMKTGEVTFAVRETKFNGEDIDEGDIIGISGKDIISKGENTIDVTLDLIEELYSEDFGLLSIYYGEDTTEADGEKLRSLLEEKYEDMDVELTYGGQPLYYYIISME